MEYRIKGFRFVDLNIGIQVLALMLVLLIMPKKHLVAQGQHAYSEIGFLSGESIDSKEYIVALGTMGTVVQGSGTMFGDLYTYGHYFSHIEFGTGFGVSGSGLLGQTQLSLTSKQDGNGIFPHIGIEPLKMIYSANTKDEREDYIEWQPMGSLGLRFFFGDLKILALGRAGWSLGTLSEKDSRSAWGVANYLIWKDLDFALEMLRIKGLDRAIDVWNASFSHSFSEKWALGLHAEAITTRQEFDRATLFTPIRNEESRKEYRIGFYFRYKLISPIFDQFDGRNSKPL